MKRSVIKGLALLVSIIAISQQICVHDHFTSNASFHFYEDLTQITKQQSKTGRLLQSATKGITVTLTNNQITSNNLRIYMDYSQLQTGNTTEINLIKRVLNISANYYYRILAVNRISKLFYPANKSLTCSNVSFPSSYVTTGAIGDIGLMISNQNSDALYLAKSTACILLASNNRPIWGVMVWNNKFLQYDQVGFQKVVYVAIHQLTHILGYSSTLYQYYFNGNPYRFQNNTHYLTSPLIISQVQKHFNCSNPLGIVMQDQDGTTVPSHHQRKIFGNEFMIPSAKIGSYYSRITLALLASTGWYTTVSYNFTQPTVWGKSQGCNFLNVDNCSSPQFCTGTNYLCNYDVTAIGSCVIDPYANSCKLVNYYTNTICIDENYQIKNLNAGLMANQRGGDSSRCFVSNFRSQGLTENLLSNRCYVSVCSANNAYLYILVGSSVLVCSATTPGVKVAAPPGLDGTLTCPTTFANYCSIKKTCAYSCNKNGVCINGLCLCTGSTVLTQSCLDVSYDTAQVGLTGGLLFSRNDQNDVLGGSPSSPSSPPPPPKTTQSLNNKCFDGTFFDPMFGDCSKCAQIFNCQKCTFDGCVSCPPGTQKNTQGKCLPL